MGRGHAIFVAVISLAATYVSATPALIQNGPEAQGLLESARAAMGGSEKLDAIKSVTFTGRERFLNPGVRMGGPRSPKYVDNEIKIQILLPDHYLRAVTRLGMSQRTTVGISGGRVFGTQASSTKPVWQRENMGRLLLCLLLRVDSVYTLSLAGREGNVLRFVAPDKTVLSLELDEQTKLPKLLTFSAEFQATAASVAGRKQAVAIEISDYRLVGDLRLPHRLVERTEVNTKEIDFDAIVLDPPLTPSDFRGEGVQDMLKHLQQLATAR